MFAVFLENLKRLSVFIIISQTILHFGVGRKYEKYVKLVLSFMVIAQLVFSLTSYFYSGNRLRDGFSKEKYYLQWEEYMKGFEKEYTILQDDFENEIQRKNMDEEYVEEGEVESITIEKIVIP